MLRKKNNSRRSAAVGFSLVELLIVLAIIMIIAAISIPSLLGAKKSAFEAAAVSFLRQVQTRQVAYANTNDKFADRFSDLGLDQNSAGSGSCKGSQGNKGKGGGKCDVLVSQGYIFTLDAGGDEWDCIAEPIRDRSTGRYFFINETGVIRYKHGKRAKKKDPAI